MQREALQAQREVSSKAEDALEKEESFSRHCEDREAAGQWYFLGSRDRPIVSNPQVFSSIFPSTKGSDFKLSSLLCSERFLLNSAPWSQRRGQCSRCSSLRRTGQVQSLFWILMLAFLFITNTDLFSMTMCPVAHSVNSDNVWQRANSTTARTPQPCCQSH